METIATEVKAKFVPFFTQSNNKKVTYGSISLVLSTYFFKFHKGLLELLENLILGYESLVLVHYLLDFLLPPVLDGPILQLGLCQHKECHNAALKGIRGVEKQNMVRRVQIQSFLPNLNPQKLRMGRKLTPSDNSRRL